MEHVLRRKVNTSIAETCRADVRGKLGVVDFMRSAAFQEGGGGAGRLHPKGIGDGCGPPTGRIGSAWEGGSSR